MTASLREAAQIEGLLAFAEEMMRDSWEDGSDASWKPARDTLEAALRAALAVPEAEPVAPEDTVSNRRHIADAPGSAIALMQGFQRHITELETQLAAPQPAPVERKPQEGWVSVSDKLPGNLEVCDWFFPKSFKSEYWILCSECILTASVPGDATHWRPAQAVPVEAERIKAAP